MEELEAKFIKSAGSCQGGGISSTSTAVSFNQARRRRQGGRQLPLRAARWQGRDVGGASGRARPGCGAGPAGSAPGAELGRARPADSKPLLRR